MIFLSLKGKKSNKSISLQFSLKGKKSNVIRKFHLKGKSRIIIEIFRGKEKVYILRIYIPTDFPHGQCGKKCGGRGLPHTTSSTDIDKEKIIKK